MSVSDAVVRDATTADLEAVVTLAALCLGEGWMDLSRLDPGEGRIVLVAEARGVVVGAATADVVDAATAVGRLPGAAGAAVEGVEGPVLYLDNAVVDPDMRRRGIYAELLRARLRFGCERGARSALTVGWRSPRGCHIEGSVIRQGFTRVIEIDEAYTEWSLANGLACPECGLPCRCGAVIFSRTLDPPRKPARGAAGRG